MYKVFINDSSLTLRNTANTAAQNYQGPEQLSGLIAELEQAQLPMQLELAHSALQQMWNDFKGFYKLIHAAGGVVKNDKGEILLIYRWEKWDLPKGKVEPGEDYAEAAVREVMEECGVNEPLITAKLPSTFHTYERGGEKILKETHWYEMKLSQTAKLVPQTEEDITEVGWFAPGIAERRLEKSYASLNWLFQQYLHSKS